MSPRLTSSCSDVCDDDVAARHMPPRACNLLCRNTSDPVLAPTADYELQLIKGELKELKKEATVIQSRVGDASPDAPIWQAVAAINNRIKELQVKENMLLSQAGELTGGMHAALPHIMGAPRADAQVRAQTPGASLNALLMPPVMFHAPLRA
jgi:hypothetical protein